MSACAGIYRILAPAKRRSIFVGRGAASVACPPQGCARRGKWRFAATRPRPTQPGLQVRLEVPFENFAPRRLSLRGAYFFIHIKDSDAYARRHRTGAAAHNCKVIQKGLTPKQRYDIIKTGNMGVANRRLAPWGKYDEYFLHKGVVVWILHSCVSCST